MNKTGHLLITKEVLPDELKPYTTWILLGSILPDILVHTYLRGHTWKTSFKQVISWMDRLEEWGSMDFVSCICLGYIVHYVEDYFTSPHNEGCIWSLKEHITYEHHLTKYIKEDLGIKNTNFKSAFTINEMEHYIRKLHHSYMNELKSMKNDHMETDDEERDYMETDSLYMKDAVGNLLYCFSDILKRNKAFYRNLQREAFETAAYSYLLFPGMEEYI